MASCFAASPWIVRSIRSKTGCDFWSSRTRFISCRNCSGWSTKSCASCSGRSRTIAISIAPPSFWKRAGRPSWSFSRIETALFSYRPFPLLQCSSCQGCVLGGACSRCGLPRYCTKRLLGGLARGRCCSPLTIWSIASSVTSLDRDAFR